MKITQEKIDLRGVNAKQRFRLADFLESLGYKVHRGQTIHVDYTNKYPVFHYDNSGWVGNLRVFPTITLQEFFEKYQTPWHKKL